MIQLKKANEVFTYGMYELLLAEDPQIFVYTRTLSQDRVIVMANLSERPASISEGIGIVFDHKNLLLKNYEIEKHEPTERITLKPYETRVYRL